MCVISLKGDYLVHVRDRPAALGPLLEVLLHVLDDLWELLHELLDRLQRERGDQHVVVGVAFFAFGHAQRSPVAVAADPLQPALTAHTGPSPSRPAACARTRRLL